MKAGPPGERCLLGSWIPITGGLERVAQPNHQAPHTRPAMTKILAIDLGKFKSVACTYPQATDGHRFTTIPTRPQDVHDLIVQEQPDRVVIEGRLAVGVGV